MSLREKLEARKATFRGMAPPAVQATMARATQALRDSGQAERTPKPGDKAPLFSLPDSSGTIFAASALLARGPLVVSFYRGVWCPYCNLDLEALEGTRGAIEAAGASLVAISPQTPPNSRKAVEKGSLGFPILCDAGNEVAAAFGLRFRLPDDLIEVYKGLKVDLPAFNGDDSWTLPMPARFVIGRDGVIRYAEVNPDYTDRPEPEDLLPALRGAA